MDQLETLSSYMPNKLTKTEKERFDDRESPPKIALHFENIHYLECSFWGGKYIDCEWRGCRFTRSKFANGVIFDNCRFVNCRFEKEHTSLNARYIRCQFDNCDFLGVLTTGAVFEDCRISGRMNNMLFYGRKVEKRFQCVLRNVDMTGVVFGGTDFTRGMDLSTTRFGPTPGLLYIEGVLQDEK